MRIDAYSLQLTAQSQQTQLFATRERLSAWRGPRPDDPPPERPPASTLQAADAARLHADDQLHLDDPGCGPGWSLIKGILEAMFGIRIELVGRHELQGDQDPSAAANAAAEAARHNQAQTQQDDWGAEYQRETYYREQESMSFAARGSLTTRDGQTLNFELNVSLSRSFETYSSESLRLGNAKAHDPLLFTLDGSAGAYAGSQVLCDVNLDGQPDPISLPAGGGWLALDKNGDGRVTDGSELFGPQSNDGFAELAGYDDDHNGVIDEGDAIFAHLRLWTGREGDVDTLKSLKELKIGAILLPNIAAPFTHKDQNNNTLASVRSAGVYLKEDGQAGMVSQIDLRI